MEVKETLVDELRRIIKARIAIFEAETRNDYIFAWNYGLGVAIRDGEPIAVQLENALALPFRTGLVIFKNGDGLPAVATPRMKAMKAFLPTLREMLAQLDEAQS